MFDHEVIECLGPRFMVIFSHLIIVILVISGFSNERPLLLLRLEPTAQQTASRGPQGDENHVVLTFTQPRHLALSFENSDDREWCDPQADCLSDRRLFTKQFVR